MIPRNWRAFVANVAHVLHFSVADLCKMTFPELMKWHAEAIRIMTHKDDSE